ncbi:hypothetical protein AcV7_010309 [Taiwanofungus camphoratus]|nr:hypothetical protein AcV7_010309 [Antrodia cinnamomea]
MAALYLHQALFASEPSPPPTLAHRSPGSRTPHDRQLSSVSSVTLRTTSHSDHSHPTEPLLHPPSSESSVYLDLLSRQPHHPDGSGSGPNTGLNLEGDPVTVSERRGHWERVVRKRLRRLRWTRRSLLVIIGAWAIFNTVRYFVASTIYKSRDRQIILLVLGTSTALSVASIIASLTIAAFAPHLGWAYRHNAPHIVVQTVLKYLASALLLGPAVVNLVLVFVWRHSTDAISTLLGRCHWDIDVVWSGTGRRCDTSHSPAWGYWIAGSVVRVILTLIVLVIYHFTSYQYDVTRQPSRRRRLFRLRSAVSLPSATGTANSTKSLRAMAATSSTAPVSVGQVGRQPSESTAESLSSHGSASGSGEHRKLRSSRFRITSGSSLVSGQNEAVQLQSAKSMDHKDDVHLVGEEDDACSNSSEGDSPSPDKQDEYNKYGRQVRRIPGAYTSIPPQSPSQANHPKGSSHSSSTDRELHGFVDRFRSLLDQITRETEDGIALAQNDVPGLYAHPDGTDDEREQSFAADGDRFSLLGRTIHRMPTIESMSSRDVMSLANSSMHRVSPHALSRPSTRTNMLDQSEGGQSTPRSARSRANSWDAALALAAPAEQAEGEVSEMGEMASSSASNPSGPSYQGSGSTVSYHTARSFPLEKERG